MSELQEKSSKNISDGVHGVILYSKPVAKVNNAPCYGCHLEEFWSFGDSYFFQITSDDRSQNECRPSFG